jgi:hypothetical protein
MDEEMVEWCKTTFPHIELRDRDMELSIRAHTSAMSKEVFSEPSWSERRISIVRIVKSKLRHLFSPVPTTGTEADHDAQATSADEQTDPPEAQIELPPLTYPIYLTRTYPEQTREVIVYSIGYSPDNLIARFGINSSNHVSYPIEITKSIGDEAYQIVLKHLHEYIASHPYPQTIVIGEEGILEAE